MKGMLAMTKVKIEKFKQHLIKEEKSELTVKKYIADISEFFSWIGDRKISKELVIEYKNYLINSFAPASVNSKISALNSFFDFLGLANFKVKAIKIQRKIFASKDRELTKDEYYRLLAAAKTNKRLYYIMQTICSCGIRVSELKYVTVQAIKARQATISCKGKMRTIMLPNKLCRMLLEYANKESIKNGAVFVSRNGNPIDRSNIWRDMNKLCEKAKVDKNKVFPHNLRHLFARCYYSVQKDIVRLADILGHSNINTTRIYTIESGETHLRQLQSLGLLMC